MELREYWRILVRRWWLALLPALFVAAYTLLTYDRPPTVYQAHMNFAAGLPPEPRTESFAYDGYYAWLTSEYIANSLADIARRERFAAAVSARLAQDGVLMPDGSPIPSGAIQGAIASDNAQSVFVIYVTWGDPDTLLAIADAVTLELTENTGAYFPQLTGPALRATQQSDSSQGEERVPTVPPARRVDDPVPVALPPSLRNQLTGPVVRMALGLAVGLGLVFLLHYLDPTIRERAELEALGYEVLAEIPRRSRLPFRR
jgi:capsular polysaccharide biosynthesis protein